LAGRIPHRRGASEEEEEAANYLYEQFKSVTPYARTEPFLTVEYFGLVFALYYAEFFIVFFIGIWFPFVSAGYGTVVFFLFLLEFAGRNPLGRIIPQYESQNIVAPINSLDRKRLVIIAANYDTPLCNPIRKWVGMKGYIIIHCAMLLAMMGIIVGTVGVGIEDSVFAGRFQIVRWVSLGLLAIGTGIWLLYGKIGEDTRGAVQSASGVAVQLEVARRLSDQGLYKTDVWLVAVGAGESGRAGIQHALRPGDDIEVEKTVLINLASIGAGDLCYTIKEQSLTSYSLRKPFSDILASTATSFNVSPFVYSGIPTNAFWGMTRSINSTSIMGRDEHGPAFFNRPDDTSEDVELDQVEKTVDFILATLQKLDNS
jgi:hypothetical protein